MTKNLQATPDMELIRQQFEGLNKYDPIVDHDSTAIVEDSNYHGHFSKNEGVFAIFLDIIQDIKDKFQQKEEDEEFTCNCYIKPSSKNLASYVIKSSQPSEEIEIGDLPKVKETARNKILVLRKRILCLCSL